MIDVLKIGKQKSSTNRKLVFFCCVCPENLIWQKFKLYFSKTAGNAFACVPALLTFSAAKKSIDKKLAVQAFHLDYNCLLLLV
ncbi:hypothetical protein CEN44_15695 [Fischerella muscicola CCMEE 5323]|uniref:Uncharacterized protein n=1 Tax=Fischerella muscicola CCMEE 5323 TaxID=2019572 RepID=A0A2N6K166_FISMU|nr:hypothetical protein CEN44_15695 [Fischerella muscicola CCMEE 5323]